MSAGAQTPAPLANPNLQFLSSGGIAQQNGMVLQADGKIVIASGSSDLFARIGGVIGQRHIARLNADGSLDSSFTVDTNGPAQVFDGGAFLYVGGTFTSIGGVARNGLARISVASGQVDAGWNPAPANPSVISGGVADAGNAVYLIGAGLTIGGLSNVSIVKLDPVTGAAVAAWAPVFPSGFSPSQLAIFQTSLYVIGGVASATQSNRIYKVSTTNGALDPAFTPDLNAIDMFIRTAVTGPSGDLFIASEVPPIGLAVSTGSPSYSAPVKFLRLLAATGAVAPGWSPPATPGILSMAVNSSGVYAIHGIAVGDSSSRWGTMRYDLVTGQPSAGWATPAYENYNGAIVGAIVTNSTDLYIGGHFSFYGGPAPRRHRQIEHGGRQRTAVFPGPARLPDQLLPGRDAAGATAAPSLPAISRRSTGFPSTGSSACCRTATSMPPGRPPLFKAASSAHARWGAIFTCPARSKWWAIRPDPDLPG